MEVSTSIEIQATGEEVWKALTDFDSYPKWNPFLRRVNGQLKVGERLSVQTKDGPGSPTILWVEEGREIRLWNRFMPGLDGEHIFAIESIQENLVRFVHDFYYRGNQVEKHALDLERSSRRDAESMNKALKKWVENSQKRATPHEE